MNGYQTMSERGRLVAEYVELSARHRIEELRASIVPGHAGVKNLETSVQKRYQAMTEAERAAAVALQTMGYGHRFGEYGWNRT